MIKLELVPLTPQAEEDLYKEDILRIVSICAEAGYSISESDARQVWEDHSGWFCASWLFLPEDKYEPDSDEKILKIVLANTQWAN